MAEGGRAFFAARRRGDVEKNWVRWKLLVEKRWIIRGVKAQRHPLEKADILKKLVKLVHGSLSSKKFMELSANRAHPCLARPSDFGGTQPP